MLTSKISGKHAELTGKSKNELIDEVVDLRRQIAETERQRTKLALSWDELQFRTMTDNMVDGVITIDSTGVVASINPAAEGILGYTAEEVVGQNVSMLMHQGDLSAGQRMNRELELQRTRLAEAQQIGNIGNWERDFITGELHRTEQVYRISGQADLSANGHDRAGFLLPVHET
nr:PAS domain S-box protein [Alphaproteobacteria bacterium]